MRVVGFSQKAFKTECVFFWILPISIWNPYHVDEIFRIRSKLPTTKNTIFFHKKSLKPSGEICRLALMRLFLFSICARIMWWSREEGNDPFPAYTTACRLFWFTVHWFCHDLGCNHLSLHMDRLHLILINLTWPDYQECLEESRQSNDQLQTSYASINRGNFTPWFK